MTDRPVDRLSSERLLGALAKLVATLDDPRVQLYIFFLEQLRPFTRSELLRMLRIDVLPLSPDQIDRALAYLFQKNCLGKLACGKEILYFPVV